MDKRIPVSRKAASGKENSPPDRGPFLSRADRWQGDSDGERRLASEDDCLALIDEFFPSHSAHVPRGRGDDCALLTQLPQSMALSTDMFWEDTHFRTSYFTPEETGGKALAAAASDLAAAGAVPMAFSLGLMLPDWLERTALRAVLSGMADRAGEYGMYLSGGDLSRGAKLGFSVTVWGESSSPGAPALHRATARPGDVIFLVGRAGLARVGLWALEQWGRAALETWPQACAAHLSPRPLLAEGQAIAQLARLRRGDAHRLSLMDVSDGLMRDLPRLLGSLGADLDFDKDIIPPEVIAAADAMRALPEEIFLLGGEDYALIGSCAEKFWPRLSCAAPGARLLGRAAPRPGVALHRQSLSLEGFDHFAGGPKRVPAANGPGGGASAVRGLAGGAAAISDAVKELIAMGREAWTAGLMAGFNGNISCRVPLESGRSYPSHGTAEPSAVNGASTPAEACLITRSGAAKGRLTKGDFALLDSCSGVLLDGPAASTESAVHLAIYAACPQSRFVLHVHPPCLLALSLILEPEKRLVLPLPEAATYRASLGHAPFYPPGSAELAAAAAKAAQTHAAVWMERHGLVVHAKDAPGALALAEELEQLAKVQLGLLSALAMPPGNGANRP